MKKFVLTLQRKFDEKGNICYASVNSCTVIEAENMDAAEAIAENEYCKKGFYVLNVKEK